MRREIMITVSTEREASELLKFFEKCARSVDSKATVRFWGEGGIKRQLQSIILTQLNEAGAFSPKDAAPQVTVREWLEIKHSQSQFYRAMASLRNQGLVGVVVQSSNYHHYYLTPYARKQMPRASEG